MQNFEDAMRSGYFGQVYSDVTIYCYSRTMARFFARFPEFNYDNVMAYLMEIPPERIKARIQDLKVFKLFGQLDAKRNEVYKRIKDLKYKNTLPIKRTFLEEDKSTELIALSEQSKLVDELIVKLLRYTALRLCELHGIKMNHIDLTKRIILVYGKGNKIRKVGLTDVAYECLVRYLGTTNKQADDALFNLSKRTIRRKVTALGREIGEAISPHSLRRTFASINSGRGVTIKEISDALGHASVSTTLQCYVINNPDTIANKMRQWG